MTKTYRIYGANGHRQKASFGASDNYDFTGKYGRGTCLIHIAREDELHTNEYVEMTITCDTAEEIEAELNGQLSDGFFENIRTGKVEEVENNVLSKA